MGRKQKMCEDCGKLQPSHTLPGERTARWCSGCGKGHDAVSSRERKMCEGCGLKRPLYGLASEGKARWCAKLAKTNLAPHTESKTSQQTEK